MSSGMGLSITALALPAHALVQPRRPAATSVSGSAVQVAAAASHASVWFQPAAVSAVPSRRVSCNAAHGSSLCGIPECISADTDRQQQQQRRRQQQQQHQQHHFSTQQHHVVPSPLGQADNWTSIGTCAPKQPLARVASVRVPLPGSVSAPSPPSLSPEPRPCGASVGAPACRPLQPGLMRAAHASIAAPSHPQASLDMTSSSIGSVAARRARSYEPPPVQQLLSYVPQRSTSVHQHGMPHVLASQTWAPPILDARRKSSPSVQARTVSRVEASNSDESGSLAGTWQTVSLGSSHEVDASQKTISSTPDLYWAGSSAMMAQYHVDRGELAPAAGPTLLQSRPRLRDYIARDGHLAKVNISDSIARPLARPCAYQSYMAEFG